MQKLISGNLVSVIKLAVFLSTLTMANSTLAAGIDCAQPKKIGELKKVKCDVKVNPYQQQIGSAIFNASDTREQISQPLSEANNLTRENASLGEHSQLINYLSDDSLVRGRVSLSRDPQTQELQNHAISPNSKATQLFNVIK